MDLGDRETGSGARMTLAASHRKILRIDGGFGIRRRKNVMYAVATGAIRHRLIARLCGQSMKRFVEAHQTIFGHLHLAGKLDISVAPAAGIADVRAEHWRVHVGGPQNGMGAVTIGADRRLPDALRDGLSMD